MHLKFYHTLERSFNLMKRREHVLNAAYSTTIAVETSTVSLRKFTEQSGRKSHNEENQTSVCDELTLSFCYPTVVFQPPSLPVLSLSKPVLVVSHM